MTAWGYLDDICGVNPLKLRMHLCDKTSMSPFMANLANHCAINLPARKSTQILRRSDEIHDSSLYLSMPTTYSMPTILGMRLSHPTYTLCLFMRF